MTKDPYELDFSKISKELLAQYSENEKIIKQICKIPKKRLTESDRLTLHNKLIKRSELLSKMYGFTIETAFKK